MDISLYRTEVQNWIMKIQSSRGADSSKTIALCNKLEEYGDQTHDDALIGFACFTRGETYYLQNDMPNFYREMLDCLKPLERIHEWGYIVMANNMLGIVSLNRGNAPFAMDYYLRSLSIAHSYQLPDLEWIVHMNMGALYLSVEDYENALEQVDYGYRYILDHPEDAAYVQNLTAACVNMGKAYLATFQMDKAKDIVNRLERDCVPGLMDRDRLAVYCFEARYYAFKQDIEAMDHCITEINRLVDDTIWIMDMFDDLFDYLGMLADIGRKEEYNHLWAIIYQLSVKTTVLNLQRRLLELQMNFDKKYENQSKYETTALKYAEVSVSLSRENQLMMSNMIALRTNLQDLTMINHQVERENELLHKKSETDPLTGMYNRFRLNTYWEETFEEAYKQKIPIAFEILDIDYFKEFNDNYGHQAGDRCIKIVADCIQSMTAYNGIFCARYGGDEFILVYKNYSDEEVLEFAKELKRKLAAQKLEHKYSKISDVVTISQGICWGVPTGYEKAWDFLHTADANLYKIKQKSRNNICIGKCEREA